MMNSDIYFSVETIKVMDGKTIRAMKPDSDGYYDNVPLMILGLPTQTGTIYDSDSILKCMKDDQQYFTIALRNGSLYGEADHPKTVTEADLPRLLEVMKQYTSHHFRKVSVVPIKIGDQEYPLVVGSIKPCGPFGYQLDDSLRNPHENTSFSLRSICEQKMVNGKRHRKVKYLATFDSVTSGGFKEASKRYCPSNESFKLTPDSFKEVPGIGTESCVITDRDFQAIFGSKHIEITRKLMKIQGSYNPGYRCFRDNDGIKRSLFHHVMRGE